MFDFPLQSFNGALEYSRCDACPCNSSSPEPMESDAVLHSGPFVSSHHSLEFANSDHV